jgi:nucleoside-diphosphate-sugar epimerase
MSPSWEAASRRRPCRQDGPGDNPYLDTTRLTRDTGFTPGFDVAAAVADYVAWRADNPS